MKDKERELTYGTLMGDAYINKTLRGNYALVFEHCIAQRPYAEWKASLLSSFKTYSYKRERNTYFKKEKRFIESQTVVIRSQAHTEFTKLRAIFYPNGKKIVTADILNKVGILGLAVWYLDDGAYHLNRFTGQLCTQGFTLEENKLIRKFLHETYDINASIVKRGKGKKKLYLIYFPKFEMKKFLTLISPFLPKEILAYKCPIGWELVKDLTFGFHERLNIKDSDETKKSVIANNMNEFWKKEGSPNGFPWVKYLMSKGTFAHTIVYSYFGSRDECLKYSNLPLNII